MAIARFHSFRGKSSALLLVKENEFVFSSVAVYVPKEAIPVGTEEGSNITIPDGYKIVPFIDFETGKVRTAEDGSELRIMAY
jgi:hypothetical protein